MYKKLKFSVAFHTSLGAKTQLNTATFFAHNTGQPKKSVTCLARLTLLTFVPSANNKTAYEESKVSRLSPTNHNSPNGLEMQSLPTQYTSSFLPPHIEGNLSVYGYICAQAYAQMSDRRFKVQVQDLVDALDTIEKLQGKRFQWAPQVVNGTGSQTKSRGQQVLGFIAQEVQKVIPGAVVASDDGYLAIDCSQLVPILIEAFKLQQQVNC